MIYAKKTDSTLNNEFMTWRVFPRNFTHVFLLQTCRSSWSLGSQPCRHHLQSWPMVWQSSMQFHLCSSIRRHSPWNQFTWKPGNEISVDSYYALEWSKSTHWFLFGIIFLGVILFGGSSNAKGMFLMVKRNLAVAHNCHSIYCLGLVVCVASLSCFVLRIWPGWSSKQSCETWGGGYCCYY